MRSTILLANCLLLLVLIGEHGWSQSVEGTDAVNNSPGNPAASADGALRGSNPNESGTPQNPNLDATDVNPVDPRAGSDIATDPLNQPQPLGTTQPAADGQRVAGADNWRLVPHNGVWWYWTPQNTWLYYRNNQWNTYMPVSVGRQQASRMSRQRYGVGYRGSSAYDAARNFQRDQYGQGQYQARGGVGLGTNFNGMQFYEQRPIAPNAVELQQFQQMQQQSSTTPFGGTSSGVQDPNLGTSNPVVGSNPIRGGVPMPGNPGMPGPSGNASAPNPAGPAGGTTAPGTTTPSGPATGASPATGTGGGGTGTPTGTGTGT